MLIYVSHPCGGKESNIKKIKAIINYLSEIDKENAYICPTLLYHDLYDIEDSCTGIVRCLEIEKHCDVILMCLGWEESTGCKKELEFAMDNGISIHYLEDYYVN